MFDGEAALANALDLVDKADKLNIVSVNIHPNTIDEWRSVMRYAEAFRDDGVCIERHHVSGNTFVTRVFVSPEAAARPANLSHVTVFDPRS